jgi:hypothetical protein
MSTTILNCHGGGSLGMFEIGFILRLDELRILPTVNAAVGVSVGALTVALIGKYRDNWNEAIKVCLKIKGNRDIYDREINIPTAIFQGMCGSQSILDPKGLYSILDIEFLGMIFNKFVIPVYVCATELEDKTYIDGGWGLNFPIKVSLELQPDKLINLGCSPDASESVFKVFSGEDNVIKSLIASAGVPILFPPMTEDGVKKKSFIDYAIRLAQVTQDCFEELDWTMLDLYLRLNEYQGKKIKVLDGYPKVALGHSFLDFSHVEEDIDKGYQFAKEYLTDEILEAFLR